MIESTHESLDRWKNPALCSYAIRQIEQHYQKICLHDLSSALKINPSYLSRVLSQNLHVTFLDLLHTKRIFVALEYFSNSKKLPQLEYLATDLGYFPMWRLRQTVPHRPIPTARIPEVSLPWRSASTRRLSKTPKRWRQKNMNSCSTRKRMCTLWDLQAGYE